MFINKISNFIFEILDVEIYDMYHIFVFILDEREF